MKNSCCSIATELLADRAYLWRSFSWRLQEKTATISLALERFFCGNTSIHDLRYVSWEVSRTLITTTLWRGGSSCTGLAAKLIPQLLDLFSSKEILIQASGNWRCPFDSMITVVFFGRSNNRTSGFRTMRSDLVSVRIFRHLIIIYRHHN